MRLFNILVPRTSTVLGGLILSLWMLAFCATIPLQAAPAPSASPSATTPPPSPASVAAPTGAIDTWRITGGKADGWESGDRVRIKRHGRTMCEAVVLRVMPGAAEIVLVGSAAGGVLRGDEVEFVRRRPPLVENKPTSTGRPVAAGGTSSSASGGPAQTDWQDVGKVEGLLGEDWMTRRTRTCVAWARKGDLPYVRAVVDGLDASFDANSSFMGFDARTPIQFYFFPLEASGHKQPRFATRLAKHTRIAGVALYDLGCCVINLGNWRTAAHFEPWEVEEVCRHEMNHIFAHLAKRGDRMGTWEWLFEALAHTIEDTVKPPSSRLDLAAMKTFMNGYKTSDLNWATMIKDRNNDELEQYRDYSKILVSVIFFLREKYGQDVMARILRGAAQGGDIEDSFVQVCGKGVRGLEVEWKAFYAIQ